MKAHKKNQNSKELINLKNLNTFLQRQKRAFNSVAPFSSFFDHQKIHVFKNIAISFKLFKFYILPDFHKLIITHDVAKFHKNCENFKIANIENGEKI